MEKPLIMVKKPFLKHLFTKFLFFCFHIKNNFKFKGFAVCFLSLISSPEFIQTDTFNIPSGSIVAIQGKCPCTGK